VPCGALRRRRSNAVGSAYPTSTPRCTSRHCTAPGKCLHRTRCRPQRRRRSPDRDLPGAGRRRDQRQARVTQAASRCVGPALQGGPPRHGLHGDRPSADPPTNRGDGLPDDRPQRERHRDRRVPVVPPRRDSARHHREHRATPHAEIASALDHDPARRAACIRRSAELAIAVTVAVEPEPATRRSAGCTAVGARSRPGGLYRGW
jgi:hypothetical protein